MIENDVALIRRAVKESFPVKLNTVFETNADLEDELWQVLWSKDKGGYDREPMAQGTSKFGYVMLNEKLDIMESLLSSARKNLYIKCDCTMFFSVTENSKGLDWHNDDPDYVLGGNLLGQTTWHSKNFDPIDLSPGEMIFMPTGVRHRVEVHTEDRVSFGIYGTLRNGF